MSGRRVLDTAVPALAFALAVAGPSPGRGVADAQVASAGLAGGQTALERFDRQLDQIQRDRLERANAAVPADRRALFDYGGYFTFDYLSADDPNHDNHGLRQYDLAGYARLDIDAAQELFARGRISWRNFNPGDSFDGEGNHSHATVELAFYRLDIALAMGRGAGSGRDAKPAGAVDQLVFTGGRQYVYWANGLALNRTLDGVSFDVARGVVGGRVIAGVTPADTSDFDSTRPNFDDKTLRGFYGAMLTLNAGAVQPFAYALVQRDYNHGQTLVTPLRPQPIVTRFDYDSYYLGTGATGAAGDHLAYGAELVYEGGSGLSNSFQVAQGVPNPIRQGHDEISAFAADARVDYLFNDPARTRVGAEVMYASGDSDRLTTSATLGGNRRGTRDNAFNGFGLINTGVAFGANVSNLLAVRLGVSSFPLSRWPAFQQLQVGIDGFAFMKADPSAPIDEPTGNGRLLGFEPDLFVNWQVRSDVTLALRYGAFLPNADVFVNAHARQFFYCGVTFAF